MRHLLLFTLLVSSIILGGCTSEDDDPNTKNIGSITFDKRSSADLTAHPLRIAGNETWRFIASSTPAGGESSATVVRELRWLGPTGNVLDVPATRLEEPSPIGTFMYFYARSTNGAIYLVRVDLNDNTYLGVGQPILAFPAQMNVSTAWTSDYGATISSIISTTATSPSGHTNCIHIRVSDPASSTIKREEYWRITDGLLERVLDPGTPGVQSQRRQDVPLPPVGVT